MITYILAFIILIIGVIIGFMLCGVLSAGTRHEEIQHAYEQGLRDGTRFWKHNKNVQK